MARDFANRYKLAGKETSKPRGAVVIEEPKPSKLSLINLESLLGIKLPAWSWLALGLLVGSLLGYYLALTSLTSQLKLQQLDTSQVELANQPTATKTPSKSTAKPAHQPKFEFYTQLITNEVEAPSVEAYKSTPRQATDVPSYLIQAGAFNNFNDAAKQQERIKNLKLNSAEIKAIETASGETWYRIYVGPSQDRRELARMQNTLNAAGIDSIRIKLSSVSANSSKITQQEQPKIKAEVIETTPKDTSLEELGNL